MIDQPIGVYDSGMGGLTVLNTLRNRFPYENFIYFADTHHLPYGNKTQEQIIDYAHQTLFWMAAEKKVKAVVAACHTSSALAVEKVRPFYSFPLIDMIYPLAIGLTAKTKSSRLGILTTRASADSQVHEKRLRQAGFQGKIVTIACPEFVPLVEAGQEHSLKFLQTAHLYLQPFIEFELDTLIYGCTHYPLLAPLLRPLLPSSVTFIDPADFVSQELLLQLHKNNLMSKNCHKGHTEFYCSLDAPSFHKKVQAFFSPARAVTLIDLERYHPLSYQKVVNG